VLIYGDLTAKGIAGGLRGVKLDDCAETEAKEATPTKRRDE